MPEKDTEQSPEQANVTTPRYLATVGLHALASYKAAGLAGPGERMHEQIARRLARVAATDNWEG